MAPMERRVWNAATPPSIEKTRLPADDNMSKKYVLRVLQRNDKDMDESSYDGPYLPDDSTLRLEIKRDNDKLIGKNRNIAKSEVVLLCQRLVPINPRYVLLRYRNAIRTLPQSAPSSSIHTSTKQSSDHPIEQQTNQTI